MAGHFIIAGSDAIAVRVAEELTRLGEDVVIMTREGIEPRFRLRLEREGVRVLEGDARDVADLQAAGLDRAMGLALLDAPDVINLHAALAAYAARPDLRLVVRMFNEELGRKLGALFPQARILSASAIAAPAFLDAALRTAQRLTIGDQAVEVRTLSRDDDLTKPVVTLFDPESRSSGLFPPAALGVLALVPAAAGEEVRDQLQATSGLGQAASFAASTLARTGALARLLDRRLIAFLGLLTAIIATAALVWTTSTRLNLLDSAYFAVTTVSTTGYGDITPLHEAATLKLASMGLMLIGALSIAVVYALITDAIVGARLARSLQERPHPRRDHVVVVGLGRIGQRVIEELVALGIPCIGVERNESAQGVQAARRLRVPVVVSDVSAPSALDLRSLAEAQCVMVLTDDDAANLLQAVNAHTRYPGLRVVLRLFDHDLAERMETAFGIASRSVASLAAPLFAAALSDRRSLATIPIGTRVVTVAELSVRADLTASELERAADGEARLVAVGRRWAPSGEVQVLAGDTVFAVGTSSGLVAMARA